MWVILREAHHTSTSPIVTLQSLTLITSSLTPKSEFCCFLWLCAGYLTTPKKTSNDIELMHMKMSLLSTVYSSIFDERIGFWIILTTLNLHMNNSWTGLPDQLCLSPKGSSAVPCSSVGSHILQHNQEKGQSDPQLCDLILKLTDGQILTCLRLVNLCKKKHSKIKFQVAWNSMHL